MICKLNLSSNSFRFAPLHFTFSDALDRETCLTNLKINGHCFLFVFFF